MSQAAQGDTIFVSGVTGTQGSATIRALLSLSTSTNPITIHALVRDPDSPQAQALAKGLPAVKLFKGEYDDPSAITATATSCTACFFIFLTVWSDATAEQRHAKNTLSVLSSIPTMKRVVYTTTAGVKDPGIPGNFVGVEQGSLRYTYFQGKHNNEIAVRKAAEQNGWVWAIFKPATFLSNFLNPMATFMYPELSEHCIATVIPADYKHYFVDPDIVGRFAAAALLGPGIGRGLPDLSSQVIDLASQVGLLEDATRTMERALAKQGKNVKITVEYVTADEAEKRGQNPIKVQNGQFLVDNPVTVDLDRVKSFGLELGTIDGFF
ncbi:uncharacterized protein Z518_04598 [Rhinocladiella mackenziei CBS 650.93]|uniref:NmrA-like domain-containing protein n=1 Tax=Rhinocladiella mackenziei CBS 650.93 TaxID=1442369 RepID=A0A0D2FWL8_9EURO|nr:uncharacterized protein Z518_04598 [Rhinocladiella mackenziei CBS 650.93]KIX06622.1 hypothetical protein Z518_04598 [Rhinocladiella mackenziei CBS 650.93]